MSVIDTPTCYRFGCFELQLGERRLLADGAVVGLGPRGFDLLANLVERAGHLVTKDELFERVWPKVVVDDSALQFQISSLRKALGADAIATVSGRGYRFVLPVSSVGATRPDQTAKPAHNLPQCLASFVGREREVARLRQLLDRARLVTLTGAGGCGKTRLAIEVAGDAVPRYADGVWLVELAALADPSHLPQAVMTVLAVRQPAGVGPLDALVAHLASKRLLLVVDNAEHLRAACAEMVDRVLQGCVDVGVLVTSRQALGVVGELSFRVPSLSMPDVKQTAVPEQLLAFESVRLFVERARLLRPHFAVTPQNAAAVALVCWRLDGIPLAIELAAGRMRAMPIEELSQRLNQRFSLLSGGSHTTLPRHRTLRSLVDWSYDLLSPAEQSLLCRLAVFAGGCTLQAAEQVCSDAAADTSQALDLLTALCDKNLLVLDDHEGKTRYRMLETVRQYARERLQEGGAEANWQDRHLTHFYGLAKHAQRQVHGGDQQTWFDWFEQEHDNLRAALSRSMARQDPQAGLMLAGWLSHFWAVRGHLAEGQAWYSALLAALPANYDAALRGVDLSIAGSFAIYQGDYAGATALYQEALVLLREANDRVRVAGVSNNLGTIAEDHGDYLLAQALYEEAVAMFRLIGPAFKLAQALVNQGNVARRLGHLSQARTILTEALCIARTEGEQQAAGTALSYLGVVAVLDGRPEEARALLAESLSLLCDLGDRAQAALSLDELAHLEACVAGGTRPASLWGASEQLRQAVGCVRPPVDQAQHLSQVAAARAVLGDNPAFDQAWQEGKRLTLKEAVELALLPSGA